MGQNRESFLSLPELAKQDISFIDCMSIKQLTEVTLLKIGIYCLLQRTSVQAKSKV